jgi:hypothetical protein
MRGEYALMSVTTMVVYHYLAIVTGSRDDTLVRFWILRVWARDHFEIQEVYRLLVLWHFRPEFADSRLSLVVIEKSQKRVPWRCHNLVLDNLFLFFICVTNTPVHQTWNDLFFFIWPLFRLLKTLNLLAVLDINAPCTATLVSDKQLPVTFIKTDRSDVCFA